MATKKIYAVKKGRQTGIYYIWDECKEQVQGFSGAEYKSFKTEQEAREYLYGRKASRTFSTVADPSKQNKDTAIAYVDGSFDNKTRRYSYGCVIFYAGKKFISSKAFDNKEMASMQNVAGEITGALAAMEWCIKNNINNLQLYYDYEGIEKWCTGVWKAKNSHTQKYKKQYDTYTTENNLKVTFNKVKAHSGNTYNTEADSLAKKALYQEKT